MGQAAPQIPASGAAICPFLHTLPGLSQKAQGFTENDGFPHQSPPSEALLADAGGEDGKNRAGKGLLEKNHGGPKRNLITTNLQPMRTFNQGN